ncbi:hypothetical protein ElyMa_003857800 [Elysia marginata]|uniref:Uncharacterized protein n=1 Tax=Elysia marginata TaxID=1093978 RepID=A0AAV4FJ74_9GAST|nr:hypothetical protein ElyMa_003857800 [Elysia marginata]
MKCALVFAALLAVCLAANNHNHGHANDATPDPMIALVQKEVQALYSRNSHLTLEACTHKCDELFTLLDATDEANSDSLCAQYCKWSVFVVVSCVDMG